MITMEVDVTKAVSWFDDTEERQLPFAISKALNDTAKDFQFAQRQHMHSIFHLNRETWADRNIKITHFATKEEQWAQVAIAPPGNADKSDIFGKFEDDTSKTPSNGGHSIVIPVNASRTGTGVIAKNQRPRAFNFREVRTTAAGTVFVGDQNTLMIQRPDGRGVIIQRNATHTKGVDDGTVLFTLVPEVKITPDLHFYETADVVVDHMFQERFDAAWELALETAR